MRKIFLTLISFYQKTLSPHKGYSCAYGVLHQDGSCSSRVYSIIQNSQRADIFPEISAQFKACKKAHHTLASEEKKENKSSKDHYWCVASECSAWACLGILS